MSPQHVVVVGASLGGLRAAEQLRARGFDGRITVIGDEAYLPYNRPPLSKEVLADDGNNDPTRLHGSVEFRRRPSTADVEFVLGDPVTRADLAARRLFLGSGQVVHYDGLVVATGLRPRRLALPGPGEGRHWIRTLDDCVALRADVARAPGDRARVVVIGAGFIGCETAATLLRRGCEVTVVEPFGAQARTTPAPATGEGTSLQCPILFGFQVPQRHSSLPVAGSCPVRQSPPAIRSSLRPPCSNGIGVLNASRDSATAALART